MKIEVDSCGVGVRSGGYRMACYGQQRYFPDHWSLLGSKVCEIVV